ncbi:MAG: metal-dependent hydrolase [Mailhella sp.]|nr:metal-dependent hydrolase [Mailhella sp.]
MRWATHQAMSVMAAFAIGLPAAGIAAVWAGSVFPDVIDQRSAAASFFRQSRFNKTHRKSSHWFGWWLIPLAASRLGLLGPLPDAALEGFALGCLSHVLLDMCTTKGVPLLPFGSRRASLKICSTGGVAEYAILGMSILLFWLAIRAGAVSVAVPLY